MSDSLKQKYQTTPLFGGNAPFLEDLYEQYLQDPDSVEEHWRSYFRGFETARPGQRDVPHGPIISELERRAREHRMAAQAGGEMSAMAAEKQAAVIRLIEAFRGRGHQAADIDPLGLQPRPEIPDLEPGFHGLSESDMDTEFSTPSMVGPDRLTLRQILDTLRETYCGRIGFEYMHVTDTDERRWIRERVEGERGRVELSDGERLNLLKELNGAEGLEKYLHTRYVGQKRFSLEGGESLIPMLEDIIQQGGRNGVREIVVGMAHRGRLNVLVNVLGKSPRELFSEFEGVYDAKVTDRSGDVKYHLGFSSDIKTAGGNVHLALAFNPSHLEIVNPVVEGSVRARQDRRGDRNRDAVLPVLIHGDASFAGQGVVMETLQMSQTPGFTTGGTLHIICNNQIGFTTTPNDARSTPYSTDVAKMIEAPIFHVNGDDPEAVIYATRLALAYRQAFNKDVVIDLICYRRHGHNEADEPSATQPLMYKTIKAHPTVRAIYAETLEKQGLVTSEQLKQMADDYRDALDEGETVARDHLGLIGNEYTVDWSSYNKGKWDDTVKTAVPVEKLEPLFEGITTIPDNFRLHSRVQRVIDERKKMAASETPMDWGFAETMAYATLLTEGYGVRLCGQDSGRGTFFHRHAELHNQEDREIYVPLQHLDEKQEPFVVIDSLLSEEAVLGFEYGYSTAEPDTLVIWEAQFGDFANGAQVIVDQFLSSGEAKWGRLCGLVMFLPHGYEGQGPEHSSARLERYLQLCAQHNIQVCVPSTPAQMFHMLRRQMVRPYRKPLIVMTPKSLLRHRLSVSDLSQLSEGHFHNLIPEVDNLPAEKVHRVVFCSGKVYYDLLEARRADEIDDVAIVRIEQLYPFPADEYEQVLKSYANAMDVIWCQEEPENQGAWYQIRHRLQAPLTPSHTLTYAGREASASTAAGYFKLHMEQQKALIGDALGTSRVKGEKNESNSRKSVSEKA